METLLNILTAVLGILLYTVFNAHNKLHRDTWSTSRFISDNALQWVWSVLMVTLIALSLGLEPTIAEAIKQLTGIDVQSSRAAFFTLGIGLSVTFREGLKK